MRRGGGGRGGIHARRWHFARLRLREQQVGMKTQGWRVERGKEEGEADEENVELSGLACK